MPRWNDRKVSGEMLFHRRIRDLRLMVNATVSEIAGMLGLKESTYANYDGKVTVKVPLRELVRIASFWGVSVQYLLGLTNDSRPMPDEKPEWNGTYPRIRILRENYRYTSGDLAKKLEMSVAMYSIKERQINRNNFSMYEIAFLAQIYGTTVDYLLGLTYIAKPRKEPDQEILPDLDRWYRKYREKKIFRKEEKENEKAEDISNFRKTSQLKILRQRFGSSQRATGKFLGVSNAQYSRYERIPERMSVIKYLKLAGLYGVTVKELISGASDLPLVPDKEAYLERMIRKMKKTGDDSDIIRDFQERSRLKETRKQNYYTQGDIAKILGITEVLYKRYEKRPDIMSILMYKKLAEFYNVTIEYLTGYDLTEKI